jgi:F-type H+-transporting ATPase subunit b
MKITHFRRWHYGLLIGCAFFFLLLWPGAAFAAEEPSSWRATYDLVMRWLNAAILIFVIIKFGRSPLTKFLMNKKEEIAEKIEAVEQEKAEADQKIIETQKIIEDSDRHYAQLKERIIQQGEKRKQQIIEDARKQSRIMLEDAKQKVQAQLRMAQQTLQAELVDATFDIVLEKLPQEITDDDNQKMVDQFIAAATQ